MNYAQVIADMIDEHYRRTCAKLREAQTDSLKLYYEGMRVGLAELSAYVDKIVVASKT